MISSLIIATLVVNEREAKARVNVYPILKQYCQAAGVSFPAKQIMFRAFKDEKILEIWGASSTTSKLRLLQRYRVLAASGSLGPKRQYGDMQVPEGWYYVDRFNPFSQYHLSLGLNYPNHVDRELATSSNPGGDIFIHGNRKSAGCLAMGDPAIEEIYTFARMATGKVRVLILPSRTKPISSTEKPHRALYDQIYPINLAFDKSRRVPKVEVNSRGYRVLP
jgi:murein L,D-transpeptidase YafK